MSESKVSIMSKAAVLLGDSPISGDDGSDAYEICDMFYDNVYEDLLRHREWTFARSKLHFVELDTTSELGYSYVYQILPTVLSVSDINASTASYTIIGKQLHTNLKDPLVSCIVKPEEYTLPADFVRALTYILASQIAIPLVDDTTRSDYYFKLADMQVTKAVTHDLSQEPQESFAYNSNLFAAHYSRG